MSQDKSEDRAEHGPEHHHGEVIAQITIKLPRLMEVSEYRKLRYAGGKPSVQQLKKWIEEGEVPGKLKAGCILWTCKRP